MLTPMGLLIFLTLSRLQERWSEVSVKKERRAWKARLQKNQPRGIIR